MPAGIQIINTTGSVQIDETYKNSCFKQKGTLNFLSGTSQGGGRYFDITASGSNYVNPIVALQCSARHLALLSRKLLSGTSLRIQVGHRESDTSDFSFSYFIFDDCPDTSSSTMGAQVFNAAGKLTFDAVAFKYMRAILPSLTTFYQTSHWTANGAGPLVPSWSTTNQEPFKVYNYVMPSGNYGFIPGRPGLRVCTDVGGGQYDAFHFGLKNVSATQIEGFYLPSGIFPAGAFNIVDTQVVIVDLAGL